MNNQKIESPAQNTTSNSVTESTSNSITVSTAESKFTGGAFANYFINLLTIIVSIITVGLAYPAMSCWKLRWEASHTYINGKQLVFTGKGIQLFGKFLLWLLLSIITFGIYYLVAMKVSIIKWQTKHTHIVGEEDKESEFDGHWYQLLGLNIVHCLVFIITLSFGLYWIHCHTERWFYKHKSIDGHKLVFEGKAIGYFGKCILWGLLTVITIGIFNFWVPVKSKKWTISHTHFENAILENANSENANSENATVTQATESAATQTTTQSTNGGGFGLSLAGLILAFFQPQIGLILSIIGTVMSSKANNKSGKTIGIVGLVLCSVILVAIIVIYVYMMHRYGILNI